MYNTFDLIFDKIKGEIFIDTLVDHSEIFFVGGCVRDCFLGLDSKDIDILVTGLSAELIKQLIAPFGKVTETSVGDKFGVIKFVSDITGNDYDLSIPRKEVKVEAGHKGFDVFSDPNLSVEDDLARRDFTINAIALDINKRIIDPFNGVVDIQNKQIRKVSDESFSDDPLRMMRAIQFVSRLDGFVICDETYKSIIKNHKLISQITPERILIELDKIYNKGEKAKGLYYLKNSKLHSQLFGTHKIRFENIIKTRADFYFSILYDGKSNPSSKFKTLLAGDAHTMSVMNSMYQILRRKDLLTMDHLTALKTVFEHNKYFKDLCLSRILKQYRSLSNAFHCFLVEGCPITYNDLNISGNFFLDKVKPVDIGVLKKKLLYEVFANTTSNRQAALEERALTLIKKLNHA